MKETAAEIRSELKALGLKASVRCLSGYKIAVESDDAEHVKPVVLRVYHSKPHHWLCIRVNHTWLPMSA